MKERIWREERPDPHGERKMLFDDILFQETKSVILFLQKESFNEIYGDGSDLMKLSDAIHVDKGFRQHQCPHSIDFDSGQSQSLSLSHSHITTVVYT